MPDMSDQTMLAQHEGLSAPTVNMLTLVMTIGYERHNCDPRFLKVGMRVPDELVNSHVWYQPLTEGKFITMLHLALIRFLKHAREADELQCLDYPPYGV